MTIFLLLVGLLSISVVINKLLWKEEITIQEMLLNLILMLGLLLVFWFITLQWNTSDTQILNGKVLEKTVDKVSCRHSYQCYCVEFCTGGKDNSCHQVCQTCYDHSFDIDYNVKTNIADFRIKTIDRQGLKVPPRFAEVQKEDSVVITSTYTNYIKASNSSLFGSKITLSQAEKKEMPKYPLEIYDYYKINRVVDLTQSLPQSIMEEANTKLSDVLKEVGYNHQANAVIAITDKSEEYALKILDYWHGGKKNDVVVIIGIDKQAKLNEFNYPINYVRIHSWSLHNVFDVKLRDSILVIKELRLPLIITAIEKEIAADYQRRSFKEFEYLKWQILPSDQAVFIFACVSLFLSTLLGYYLSQNSERSR